ncbi:putative sugar lactone lactonase YvrE [Pseudolycoriella hygida]|uniref:Sugar lactone lactonase YvrE n=1 Tax=Pseudolycoriella hygida TaxID=35572 RepID=A0A9Q0N5Y1_9DIPT|nr:putative sugar lactone lactonase YvrE [Pseudolycoriella hygida]
MLKQIIFGIFLCTTAVECYRVVQVTSPTIGASSSTFWDCRTKSLYYSDYFGSLLYRYDYVANIHYTATIVGNTLGISGLIPLNCAVNQYLVTIEDCVAVVYWDGFSSTAIKLREVVCVGQGIADQVITYSKADPTRRLFTGTAGINYCNVAFPAESSLFRFDRIQGLVKNFNGMRTSGAMDWNIATGQFYHKDICDLTLMEYQWSPINGALSNGRPVFQFTDTNTYADAMTIDKFGMLYVTLYNGSSVVKINPRTSTILETYVLPARFPSSITFCGPLLDNLCVSTGNFPVDATSGLPASDPVTANDGKLYMIKDISTRGTCDRRLCL